MAEATENAPTARRRRSSPPIPAWVFRLRPDLAVTWLYLRQMIDGGKDAMTQAEVADAMNVTPKTANERLGALADLDLITRHTGQKPTRYEVHGS